MNNEDFIMSLPLEIQEKIMDRQEEQGNARDLSVFFKDSGDIPHRFLRGFTFSLTKEYRLDLHFWSKILYQKDVNYFYTIYPKVQSINLILI